LHDLFVARRRFHPVLLQLRLPALLPPFICFGPSTLDVLRGFPVYKNAGAAPITGRRSRLQTSFNKRVDTLKLSGHND
jgi:hypothetical protein